MFAIMTILIFISITSVKVFSFLHIMESVLIFLILATLPATVIWICIYLMASKPPMYADFLYFLFGEWSIEVFCLFLTWWDCFVGASFWVFVLMWILKLACKYFLSFFHMPSIYSLFPLLCQFFKILCNPIFFYIQFSLGGRS